MSVVNLVVVPSDREKLELFATEYADNGGKHILAYIAAGFSEATAKHNAKKYLNKHHLYVMSAVKRTMAQDGALVRRIVRKACLDESIPWGHRLKALELLSKNSGLQKDTLVIEDNNAADLSPEERKREIDNLIKRVNNA